MKTRALLLAALLVVLGGGSLRAQGHPPVVRWEGIMTPTASATSGFLTDLSQPP